MKMKTLVCTKYGSPDVVKIREAEKPVPKDNEVLIRIKAATITAGDDRLRGGKIPPLVWLPMRLVMGLTRLRQPVLGITLAGEIEAVGKGVTKFRVGDEVFGSAGDAMGTHAEYICLPEDGILTLKPAELSFEEAVAITFGGLSALHFLKKGGIKAGQKVLIYGASGAVGCAAVQLARHFGAEVTGVCSTANLELVKSLGASRVIDYKKEDFSRMGERYDIIFDTVGKSPFSRTLKCLEPDGFYLRAVHLQLGPLLQGAWAGLTTNKRVIGGVAAESTESLNLLKELVEAGSYRAIIDKIYPMEEAVQAHRHVDGGHKRGSVVITMG